MSDQERICRHCKHWRPRRIAELNPGAMGSCNHPKFIPDCSKGLPAFVTPSTLGIDGCSMFAADDREPREGIPVEWKNAPYAFEKMRDVMRAIVGLDEVTARRVVECAIAWRDAANAGHCTGGEGPPVPPPPPPPVRVRGIVYEKNWDGFGIEDVRKAAESDA